MDRYQVMTRMYLNNWHYINKKVLHLNNNVNFFTGHSGSGKSTVIDALQMILYANTTGQGFFNKAAKYDSNRTLLEYLRGMVKIEENNTIKYTRNRNFSATVVLEFKDTITLKCQSFGVAFDVDTTTNEITKQWFWHAGELLDNGYRNDGKPLSTMELKEYLKKNFEQDEYFLTKTDAKFKNELYSSYFGGLPPDHFIALFKKAIPFKMDMKLEFFVKNYICTEENIHIDDMKDSVTQYSNLKLKLEDTKNEIGLLSDIHDQYKRFDHCENKDIQYKYNIDKLEIIEIEQNILDSQSKHEECSNDIADIQESIHTLDKNINNMQAERDEVLVFIKDSGYEYLVTQLKALNETIETLGRSKAKYDKLAHRLMAWLETELLESTVINNVRDFVEYKLGRREMENIQSNIAEVKESLEKQKQELFSQISDLRRKIDKITKEINALKEGYKSYLPELLEARNHIAEGLEKHYGRHVKVDILADILEVKDETWLNAVEGFMGNNKTNLIVTPDCAKMAMELYRNLEPKKYYSVAVVDTENVLKNAHPALNNSLAEEVITSSDYVRAYVDYMMGSVIKCETINELRENKSGITKDCVLYQGYKLQYINPQNYTDYAYIGQGAVERRLRNAEATLSSLEAEKMPMDNKFNDISTVLGLEAFNDIDEYEQWINDIEKRQKREIEMHECSQKLEDLKKTDIASWKEKLKELDEALAKIRDTQSAANTGLGRNEQKLEEMTNDILTYNEQLLERQNTFIMDEIKEEAFLGYIEENKGKKIGIMKANLQDKEKSNSLKREEEFGYLVDERQVYQASYGYRGFSVSAKDNKEYDKILENLSSDKLAEFMQKADEQARIAVEHFKSDFVYKIRAAIVNAKKERDDLNRILDQLDFGKDKYKFIVTKNIGEDGKFYDMFMNEDLEINPHQLKGKMDGQMNLFSMKHEKNYSDLINELLEMFMPPVNSDSKTLEVARANMEKYSDYRTYLSFDMEQSIGGNNPVLLSKMMSKNSGGEGQNPLYVALLASFAQVYRINLNSKIKRRPTPRLVVLDEAFSKMDGEKVATCIGLIRKLGFQAIISAPNDKIQNYTDIVDKIFVYANQNKTYISIQEFEKDNFSELLEFVEEVDLEEEDDNNGE